MGLFLYNIFLRLYVIGIHIAALKSKKATLWAKGRTTIFADVNAWRNKIGPSEKLIWMHCASLGEFEQGRPILENIRKQFPSYKILLTFFSPSGYEVRKNYAGANATFYLPIDSFKNAKRFIEIVNPSSVIWVKYEFWYYYLTRLKQKNIPVILVSAIFRKNQPFFKWYGGLWKEILKSFNHIFVQNESSIALLQKIEAASTATIAGDTRFDRVISIAENNHPIPYDTLSLFCKNHKVIVAGSTWEEDEEELVHYLKINSEIKLIIAPHEIDEERLLDIQKLFTNSILYSNFLKVGSYAQVIIIDNIGMLSSVYALADIAYIGGGFNDTGIHNILEAAVYGKPIIFGPEYEKFSEANELVDAGAAFPIESALDLEALLDKLLHNEDLLKKVSKIAKEYVYQKQGATRKIMQYIYENRLLTN